MISNATFNNISAISWKSVLLLVEETGVPRENHRPDARITVAHTLFQQVNRYLSFGKVPNQTWHSP